MASFLEHAANPAVVGTDAAWAITFHDHDPSPGLNESGKTLLVSRQSYFAKLRVETEASFAGGTFECTIEGLTDDEHNEIVGDGLLYVTIKLGWRDLGAGGSAPFVDAARLLSGKSSDDLALVMYGRITELERAAGSFRYETKLSGVEAQQYRLRTTSIGTIELGESTQLTARNYVDAIAAVEEISIPVLSSSLQSIGSFEFNEPRAFDPATTALQALTELSETGHPDGKRRFIPVLIRPEGLHFGPWGQESDSAQVLDRSTGLVELAPVIGIGVKDPGNPLAPVDISSYTVTMLGRADIVVGDVIELEPVGVNPGATSSTLANSALGGMGSVVKGIGAAFGASLEPELSQFRVTTVTHEVDRAKGFVTTLTVQAPPNNEGTTEERAALTDASASEARRAAASIQNRQRQNPLRIVEVGEVRAQSVEDGDRGPQRMDLQVGLTADGTQNIAVAGHRLDRPTNLFNKPYLTPYAFGCTGLVVPHYPGTRVVNLQLNGEPTETVVAGCVWPENLEPENKLGDYWLSLPTDVDAVESVSDSSEQRIPELVDACSDLIDGAGRRAIHVAGFRISVGTDALLPAGQRPDDPPENELVIEHPEAGSSIRLLANGNIEILSDGELKLTADKIVMEADSVEVQ